MPLKDPMSQALCLGCSEQVLWMAGVGLCGIGSDRLGSAVQSGEALNSKEETKIKKNEGSDKPFAPGMER